MNIFDMFGEQVDATSLDCKALPKESYPGLCCVTGEESPECYKRKDLLGRTFTNNDLLKAPSSRYVSKNVWKTLGYKWERMSSWYVSPNELRIQIDKPFIRDIILNGSPCEQWAMYVTTSYKKHGALNTPVNTGKFGFIRFENLTIDCRNISEVREYWERINGALYDGFFRSTLETLDPNIPEIKSKLREWKSYYRWAYDKYHNGLYSFMLYLALSNDERKEVRTNNENNSVKIGT